MKLMIASDIHGSAAALRKLIGQFEDGGYEKLLLLGDLLYHGARNALPGEYDTIETANLLNAIKDKIICVHGNCDSEVDQMVLDFPITAEYMQIPVKTPSGEKILFATHGHRYGPDFVPPIGSCDVLLCGHTHVPGHAAIHDTLYCNPGSTSIPKGGSEPSYMTLDGSRLCWHKLETGEVYDMLDL